MYPSHVLAFLGYNTFFKSLQAHRGIGVGLPGHSFMTTDGHDIPLHAIN